MLRALTFLLLLSTPAQAWNALGHKVIADIAWQQLDTDQQKEIVDILKRHPRFSEDFRDLETDREIFNHAATWPDLARGIRGPDREKFDKPIWHYVNYPYAVDRLGPILNTSDDPKKTKTISWNVMQATNYCLSVVKSDAPPQQKALAYSWIFHLVGDMHQPMHSTALFSERFPKGDRGGNSVKLRKGDNLHSVWDNLLGRAHKPNDVKREVAQLQQRKELWKVDTTGDVKDWVDESNDLAVNFAYSVTILRAVQEPGDIPPIELSEDYYKQAGEHAKARIIAAGLRLGALLGGKQETLAQIEEQEQEQEYDFGFEPAAIAPVRTVPRPVATPAAAKPALSYWLNTETDVRHNAGCRWYKKTKSGRPCTADDGEPCGQCGG
jgi:hypothetical protein